MNFSKNYSGGLTLNFGQRNMIIDSVSSSERMRGYHIAEEEIEKMFSSTT